MGIRRSRLSAVSIVACGCAVLLAVGCGRPAASGTTPAATYLRIAVAGNHRLDHDFDTLNDRDAHRLAAAQAVLRDIAATERLFDHRLAAVAFPARIRVTALRLVSVNQARARLTMQAAASTSLPGLRDCLPRLTQANKPVEAEVRTIRRQLGLPPPATS